MAAGAGHSPSLSAFLLAPLPQEDAGDLRPRWQSPLAQTAPRMRAVRGATDVHVLGAAVEEWWALEPVCTPPYPPYASLASLVAPLLPQTRLLAQRAVVQGPLRTWPRRSPSYRHAWRLSLMRLH